MNNDTAKRNSYKLILVIVLCVVFAAVYFSVLSYEVSRDFENSIIMQIYAYTDAALIILFVILNGGLSKGAPTLDMIDESVPREKAQKTIDGIIKRKKLAKPLMFVIIPVTFTLFADVLMLFWGDTIISILKSLASLLGI